MQINITEASSPKNAATIDKDGLIGNTFTKQQVIDQISTSFVGSIKGEAIPSTVPTPYNPTTHPNGLYEKYDVKTAGTYTNFKDSSNVAIVISAGDLDKKQVQLWVENGVAKKVITEMPVITAREVFDSANNVDPATMKATYDASKTLVNHAFSDVGGDMKVLGLDMNYTENVSTSIWDGFHYFNGKFTEKKSVFKKLKIWANSNSNIQYSHIRFNSIDRTFQVLSTVNISVVPGINEFDLNIEAFANETIALKGAFTISHSSNPNLGMTYSNNKYPPEFNNGALGIVVEAQELSDGSYTVDEIKEILYSVESGDLDNSAKARAVSRITIEGQSNAYGVGSIASLGNPPFSNQPFNWSKSFSRVFIWNPTTNAYENLKIGVNTMAVPDSFGPEVGIAISWLQNNKTGLLFIDKNYGDGQPINYFTGGAYYTEKKARKENADLWLKNKGFSAREIGFVWVQGEGNMNDSSASYLSALNTLMTQRLADGFITLETIKVLAQIGSTSSNYGAGVKSAKDQYASENKLTSTITYTNNYNSDNVHLNALGQVLLGLDAGKEFFMTEKYTMNEIEGKVNWTI